MFTSSPGYASMPPSLKFVYAILILIAEGNAWWMLMAAPNRELEPKNLRLKMGGCFSCSEWILRVSRYLDCAG